MQRRPESSCRDPSSHLSTGALFRPACTGRQAGRHRSAPLSAAGKNGVHELAIGFRSRLRIRSTGAAQVMNTIIRVTCAVGRCVAVAVRRANVRKRSRSAEKERWGRDHWPRDYPIIGFREYYGRLRPEAAIRPPEKPDQRINTPNIRNNCSLTRFFVGEVDASRLA